MIIIIPFLLAAAVVSGPVTGGDRGRQFGAMPEADRSRSGYAESEYFLGGTARAFRPAGPLGADGRWIVAPESTADYKVRVFVRRPAGAKRFNGIFSQAAQALRQPKAPDALGGLAIRTLLATGRSQSAFRLVTTWDRPVRIR
jgi:hypothetical protein